MGLENKLIEIKTKIHEFHDFMIDERRCGWDDMYLRTEPIDFQVIDLENKIAVYLLQEWKSDRNDTEYAVSLGVYKDGVTKDIFNAKVYSYNAEDDGAYSSIFGSKLKVDPGNGKFEPDKQYDRIEKVELKGKQLIIRVHAPGNIYVDSDERIDRYMIDLDSVKE